MASGSDGGIFAAAAAKRRQVTGHAVRGRTTGASSKPSCPRWAEGRLGGDKGVRQSGAGVGCEKAEARQREAVRATQATIALWGWLAQGPGALHARVSSHVRGECPGPTNCTANAEAPPARGAGRAGGGVRARGVRGERSSLTWGLGQGLGRHRGRGCLQAQPEAEQQPQRQAQGCRPPHSALRHAAPRRTAPALELTTRRPGLAFIPRARAPPSGAGPTPRRSVPPPGYAYRKGPNTRRPTI